MTWRQFWCACWRRHAWELKSNAGCMYLRCAECHRETPGWAIDATKTMRLVKSKRTAAQDRQLLDMKRRWRA